MGLYLIYGIYPNHFKEVVTMNNLINVILNVKFNREVNHNSSISENKINLSLILK
ncbi:hypothetical protein GCM10008909_21730 [Hathewaya limosa]